MKQIKTFLLTLCLLTFTGIILIQTGCDKENKVPTCNIIDPENDENIPHGTQVIISVDAVSIYGNINGVSFYIDNSNSSIGISNRFPYSYTWNTLDEDTGSHTIKATATDDSGNSISDEIAVSITEGVPVSEFAAYQTSISPDSSALFYNRSINNPVSWLWDFGDGDTSELRNQCN